MNKKENLYYALGHLAYAVAMADGSVQSEERKIIHQIVTDAIHTKNPEMNISEIIFSILQKQSETVETTFDRAKNELKELKSFLDQEMKNDFIAVLYKVAEAFPPVEQAEEKVIFRAEKMLDNL